MDQISLPDQAKPRILIVDDIPDNIRILLEILKGDYTIMAVTSGEKALASARGSTPPDLILLDIMMPGMDGYEVCRQLKQDDRTRHIPVIFVTAMSEIEDETRGLELGAIDFLHKPVSPPIIKARVRNHLELARARGELARQNEILRENAQLRDDVERITRHDLKSPVSGIISLTRLIADSGDWDAERKEMLHYVEEAGYRLLDMINQSLDMYKMETGVYRLEPAPVNILKLIRQIIKDAAKVINNQKLQLNLIVRGQPLSSLDYFWLPGEDNLYYSMLANLIKNAVEASPESGSITITLDDRDHPMIIIQNMGEVPSKIRDKFFEKYTSVGKKGGTGLGTYSARLIAQTLGGDLKMTSSPQEGTSLTFELVQVPNGWQRREYGYTPMVWVPTLVAAGDKDLRRLLVEWVSSGGFNQTYEAKDQTEAQTILNNSTIGLVITDWHLPPTNGLDLLMTWRSAGNPPIPFIILADQDRQDLLQEASQAIGTEFLLKPLSKDNFLAKVASISFGLA